MLRGVTCFLPVFSLSQLFPDFTLMVIGNRAGGVCPRSERTLRLGAGPCRRWTSQIHQGGT